MLAKLVLRGLLCVVTGLAFGGSHVEGRRLHPRNDFHGHNDVIKPKPAPDGPSDTFEAHFYKIYDDATFPGFPDRPGDASQENTCDVIRGVPESLRSVDNMAPWGLDNFYQKYTEAYGIPVVGSSAVSDTALQRACYVLRFLLADRKDLRQAFFQSHGRITVIGRHERITSIPEYYFLAEEYNEATRGLGALPVVPVSSAGEENILCEEADDYLSEDILIREIAMGILHIAIKKVVPNYVDELTEQYWHAKKSGWWKDTYAILTPDSYFGEGVQSYFDVNGFSFEPDGRHNHVSIRTRLRTYDSQLYDLIQRMFPCANRYISRCNTRGHESHQRLSMDCNIPLWGRHSKRRRLDHNARKNIK